MKYAIVAHPARKESAEKLAELLGAEVFFDTRGEGATRNHIRALLWANQQNERVVILEDDAIPVIGFKDLVQQWVTRHPNSLISFYLGTERPPQWQPIVSAKIEDAENNGKDFITIPKLIHGVCYTVPKNALDRVISRTNLNRPADYAIGAAFGGEILYSIKSLVQHTDGEPVEKHTDGSARDKPRVARFLAGPLAY